MQLPDFNHAACKWDDWRAPHMTYAHNFVQFDTGELIATRWYCRDRYYTGRTISQLGLEILVSDDIGRSFVSDKRVLKTPDGDKVLQSWFPSSKGYIYDVSAQMLVRTGHLIDNPNVPTRFQNRAAAYWAGPERPPIGSELKLNKPRERTPEEKEKSNDFRALAKAWRKLSDEGKQWTHYNAKPLQIARIMHVADFEALHETEKVRIADNGIAGPYEWITLPYVKVETV